MSWAVGIGVPRCSKGDATARQRDGPEFSGGHEVRDRGGNVFGRRRRMHVTKPPFADAALRVECMRMILQIDADELLDLG
jgi:hypothetical protein